MHSCLWSQSRIWWRDRTVHSRQIPAPRVFREDDPCIINSQLVSLLYKLPSPASFQIFNKREEEAREKVFESQGSMTYFFLSVQIRRVMLLRQVNV